MRQLIEIYPDLAEEVMENCLKIKENKKDGGDTKNKDDEKGNMSFFLSFEIRTLKDGLTCSSKFLHDLNCLSH